MITSNAGTLIDDLILSRERPGKRAVVTFSLIDTGTQTIIRELESGQTIDYNDLGSPAGLSIRANLDAAQGSVVFLMQDKPDGINCLWQHRQRSTLRALRKPERTGDVQRHYRERNL